MRSPRSAGARHVAVLAAAFVASWWVASPGWARVSDHLVGDNGDAMWQLSVTRWNLDALRSLRLPWTPPMFFPTPGTYAYSDPMLTQSLVAAPFRALGASPALLSNILVVLSWTAGAYLTWRLLRRVCHHDVIALAGATAWAFSELRIATIPLFQIATAAALVPFVFERLFVALDHPTPRRGLILGVAMAATILGALYYGPLLLLTVPVAVAVWFLAAGHAPSRAHLIAAAAASLVVAVAVLPIAARYEQIHSRDHLTRAPEVAFSAGIGDFRTVASHHRLLAAVPGLRKAASGERALFPGAFVVAGVLAAGVLVVARGRRGTGTAGRLDPQLAALLAAGLVAYVLAFGTGVDVLGVRLPAPLAALDHLPGFSGIRAPVRFAVVGHLGLVAAAAVLVERALRHVHARGAVGAVAVLLLVMTMLDAGSWLPTAKVPSERRWSAVNVRLKELPRGAVVELPILRSSDGVANPRVEAPRLYLAAIDGDPRVNGYSGYQPPGFDALAAALNTFPSPAAVATLERIHVRYVVLRTDVVGFQPSGPAPSLRVYGSIAEERLWTTPARLASIRASAPAAVHEVGTFGSAVLMEVRR